MKRWSLIGCVVIVAVCAGVAQADILYDNIGSTVFSTTYGYAVVQGADTTEANGFPVVIGEGFTVSTGDYDLTQIAFAAKQESMSFADNTSVIISVYADTDEHVPGDSLASILLDNVIVTPQTEGPIPGAVVTVDFSSMDVRLVNGSFYWVVMAPANGTSAVGWIGNRLGIYEDLAGQSYYTGGVWMSIPASTWAEYGVEAPALRVEGDLVPEPATLSLLLLSAMTLLRRRRA